MFDPLKKSKLLDNFFEVLQEGVENLDLETNSNDKTLGEILMEKSQKRRQETLKKEKKVNSLKKQRKISPINQQSNIKSKDKSYGEGDYKTELKYKRLELENKRLKELYENKMREKNAALKKAIILKEILDKPVSKRK